MTGLARQMCQDRFLSQEKLDRKPKYYGSKTLYSPIVDQREISNRASFYKTKSYIR